MNNIVSNCAVTVVDTWNLQVNSLVPRISHHQWLDKVVVVVMNEFKWRDDNE